MYRDKWDVEERNGDCERDKIRELGVSLDKRIYN